MAVIGLFGGTGKTGQRVLARALEAGHEVRMLVRDPAKLAARTDQVVVVAGDVLDADAVDRTVAGTDIVVSVFGQVKGSPATLQTDGTRLIVEAMKRHRESRLITLSGGGLRAPQDRPKVADHVMRALLSLLAGGVLADAEGHLKVLEESGMEWTVVRAPRLNENAGRGKYRVGWVGVNGSTQISRDDLADFILTQMTDRRFVHQLPFISD